MPDLTDHGPNPYVMNIEDATLGNANFRATLWTGTHLQLTVMSIPAGGDIGLEVHPETDQFLRIEQGTGNVEMGPTETEVTFSAEVKSEDVIFVPAGTWHNVTNVGEEDIKLYTLYGPADHVHGTLHPTQHDAEMDPNEQH
ncbi:MAG: cupin domain-containing protein [Propionibacteriaceae bacterium]|nr:cupin domain-containing protein [Propionibacteriaceae bacterium]